MAIFRPLMPLTLFLAYKSLLVLLHSGLGTISLLYSTGFSKVFLAILPNARIIFFLSLWWLRSSVQPGTEIGTETLVFASWALCLTCVAQEVIFQGMSFPTVNCNPGVEWNQLLSRNQHFKNEIKQSWQTPLSTACGRGRCGLGKPLFQFVCLCTRCKHISYCGNW